MKLKSIVAIFLILIGTALVSCEKDDVTTGEVESFYYEETYCADPWERSDSASDEVLRERVSEYLNGTLDIDYYGLRITHDGKTEICSACSCTTGRIIIIEADKAYQDILIENGFKVE